MCAPYSSVISSESNFNEIKLVLKENASINLSIVVFWGKVPILQSIISNSLMKLLLIIKDSVCMILSSISTFLNIRTSRLFRICDVTMIVSRICAKASLLPLSSNSTCLKNDRLTSVFKLISANSMQLITF
jgi:hypothetical protein